MASPINNLNNFIENYKKNNSGEVSSEHFRSELFKVSIMSKYYPDDNVMLVYHKFDLPKANQLDEECRSLVIDMETLKVISYSCENPLLNKEALQFMQNNPELYYDIYRCYEGTLLSLFYHNKWYCSTRRCLNSKESEWKELNHFDMFLDVLNNEGKTFDEFVDSLDKDLGYYFVLLHCKNKSIIDYTYLFGEEYKKLCLICIREKESQKEIIKDVFINYKNIFSPEKITLDTFSQENNKLDINVLHEGIVLKTIKNDKSYILKMDNISYQFSKALGSNHNIFKGYLYLYQSDQLKQYIEDHEIHKNLGKITNPFKVEESFDIIGVVNCVFRVLSNELFELYKLLWSLETCEHLNKDLYELLSKEYKDILYKLRGNHMKMKNNKNLFGIKNIYFLLKNIDIEQIYALLIQRKIMLNKNKSNFQKISSTCDKMNLKLMDIFVNKLLNEQ